MKSRSCSIHSLLWLLLNTLCVSSIVGCVSPAPNRLASNSATTLTPVRFPCDKLHPFAGPESNYFHSRKCSKGVRMSSPLRHLPLVRITLTSKSNISSQPVHLNLQTSNRAVVELQNGLDEQVAFGMVQVNDSRVHILPPFNKGHLSSHEIVHLTLEIDADSEPFVAKIAIRTSAALLQVPIIVDTGELQVVAGGLLAKNNLIELGSVATGTYHQRELEIFNPNSRSITAEVRLRNERIELSTDNAALELAPYTSSTIGIGIEVKGAPGEQFLEEAILILSTSSSLLINVSAEVVSGTISAKYSKTSEFPESVSAGGANYVVFLIQSTLLQDIRVYEISVEDQGYRLTLSTLVSIIPAKSHWVCSCLCFMQCFN